MALSRTEWKDIAALKEHFKIQRNEVSIDDADVFEINSSLAELLFLLLQAKNGSFRMDSALRKFDDLRIGYEYLQSMPSADAYLTSLSGNNHMKSLIDQLYRKIETEAAKRSERASARKSEETSRQAEGAEANDIRDALLLKDIHENGRSFINTSISGEFGRARGFHSRGFQTVRDPRETRGGRRVGMEVDNAFGTSRLRYMLEDQGIQLAVTAEPVTDDVPVYETPPAPTGFLAKMFAGKPEPKQVGTRKEAAPLSHFNEIKQGTEQAWRISIIIVGSSAKGNGYRDSDTRRFGNQICGGIYLPKDAAERAMARIQRDPAFVRQLLRTFDSELMKEQEPNMPKIDRAFILPIGQTEQGYERDGRGMERTIRESFIKRGSF